MQTLSCIILSKYPDACIGIKGMRINLGKDQIDIVPSLCGGASHAPPACSGVRRRRLTATTVLVPGSVHFRPQRKNFRLSCSCSNGRSSCFGSHSCNGSEAVSLQDSLSFIRQNPRDELLALERILGFSNTPMGYWATILYSSGDVNFVHLARQIFSNIGDVGKTDICLAQGNLCHHVIDIGLLRDDIGQHLRLIVRTIGGVILSLLKICRA